MKKIFVSLLTGIMVLVFNCIVFAGEYTYNPSVSDLYDLAHDSAYSWKINLSNPDSDGNILDANSESITGASLFFDSISDWTKEANVLHVSLLDGSKIDSGVVTYSDNQERSNYFAGKFKSKLLLRFNHMGTAPRDIPVDLENTKSKSYLPYIADDGTTIANEGVSMHMHKNALNHLIHYAASGIFGLGFDPDCHFRNFGINLTLWTKNTPGNAVPEPATFLLFGAGLLFFASKMRKKYTEV